MKKDISHFAIKVICPRYDMHLPRAIPRDIEGVLLFIIWHDKKINTLVKRNEFLHTIYEANDSTEFIVRWDNDKKDRLYASNLLIRSFGKLQLYSSIWKDINIYDIVDNRKYCELRPITSASLPQHNNKFRSAVKGVLSYGFDKPFDKIDIKNYKKIVDTYTINTLLEKQKVGNIPEQVIDFDLLEVPEQVIDLFEVPEPVIDLINN